MDMKQRAVREEGATKYGIAGARVDSQNPQISAVRYSQMSHWHDNYLMALVSFQLKALTFFLF